LKFKTEKNINKREKNYSFPTFCSKILRNMDIFIEEDNQTFLDTHYVKFSTLKNGFLEQWIKNRYKLEIAVHSKFTKSEFFGLIFMFFMLFRVMSALTLKVDAEVDDTLLIYYGSPWHHMSGNFTHMETMFLLWTLNFLTLYLYVVHSPDKHYEWLEIYGFLAGIIPHKRIGISIYFLKASYYSLFFH